MPALELALIVFAVAAAMVFAVQAGLIRIVLMATAVLMVLTVIAALGYFVTHQGDRPPTWLDLIAIASIFAYGASLTVGGGNIN